MQWYIICFAQVCYVYCCQKYLMPSMLLLLHSFMPSMIWSKSLYVVVPYLMRHVSISNAICTIIPLSYTICCFCFLCAICVFIAMSHTICFVVAVFHANCVVVVVVVVVVVAISHANCVVAVSHSIYHLCCCYCSL